MIDYPTLWFVLLAVLLTGYAILDGFDLGVGIVHLLARDDLQRRTMLNSIGPLWDGNEVWLVTFGGALFAAFPVAYASILSGFYLPVMVVLLGLIGRAISIEFRSKARFRFWRAYWDVSFFLSSVVVTFVFGVALGNVVQGVPLGPDARFVGSLVDLLDPYALSVGALAVAGAAMHGCIYLYLKTEGELQAMVHRWVWWAFFAFASLYAAVSAASILTLPHTTENFARWPAAWSVVALNLLAIANIPRAMHLGRPFYAFVSSSCTIAALVFLVAMSLYPHLLISSLDPAWSLHAAEAASSESTLQLMAVIALLGMPLVLTYTAIVYWVFRGKVKLDASSY